MPWQNTSEIVVAANGNVYAAPVGTALPTGTTSTLNAAFVGLGLINTDGATLTVGRETTDIGSWQRLDPVRTIITGRTVQAAFTLQQWNEETLPFALGGGEVTGSDPNFLYEPPDAEDGVDERTLVIDWNDGDDKNFRLVIPRGIVTDQVETQLQRGAEAAFPVTFRGLAPEDNSKIFRIYTDAPGIADGS